MPEGINALYPQPPSGGLANMGIGQIVDVASGLNALEARQRELAANKALGAAVTGAPLTSSGVADPAAAWSAFRASPGAGYGPVAIDAATRMQALSAAQTELALKQRDYIESRLGSVATDPTLTRQKATSIALDVLHGAGVPSAFIQQYVHNMPAGGDALRTYLGNLRSIAQGPVAGAGRIAGPPEPGTLAPTTIPLGAANYPQPGATPGQITTAPPPGTAEAKTTVGSRSGGSYADALEAAGNYPRQALPLEKAIPALTRLGPTGTGPGTETLNDLKSFLLSGGAPLSKEQVDNVKDYDTARKYLQDWVNQNGNTQSVQHLLSAVTSNPSVHVSNAAAQDLAKVALSMRNMQHGLLREFQATGLGEEKFTDWMSRNAANKDLRYYGIDFMTPKQKNTLYNEDKQKFMSAYKQGEQSGIYGRLHGAQ
jgi:hypothetical protein